MTLKAMALTGRAAGRAALTAGRADIARREAMVCIFEVGTTKKERCLVLKVPARGLALASWERLAGVPRG